MPTPPEHLREILARLSRGRTGAGTARLCQACAEVAGVTGAGLTLMAGDVNHGTACTSDDLSALVEDLEFTLGEGPCVDAHRHGRPVLEQDLASPAAVRWPAFTPAAVAAGVGAIFAFPLRIGAVRLGALDLYRDRPGPLSDGHHADVLATADAVAQALLALQAEAPGDTVAAILEADADFHLVVHQASGMVAVQLGVGVGEALVRLRAYAFAHDRGLTDVAQDVVGRRLRLDDGAGEA